MTRPAELVDRHGRRATTLRISLTDRCNFRCVYCMPPEGVDYTPRAEYLTLPEIERVVRVAGTMGVSRYRLTGGEPLLRRDIVDVVSALAPIETVGELSMTTNGSLLPGLARPLRDAGLGRINISLDSLDPQRFSEISLHAKYEDVRAGIAAALDAGFPVKINVVVMAGIPDEEIYAFVDLAVSGSLDVRFLEFMPLCGTGWRPELVYPIGDVRELVASRFELQELPRGDRPAQSFRVAGGPGHVGFIAPLSEPFCENCSRIRISADGKLRPCLFSNYEVDLTEAVRNGTDDDLALALRRAVWGKPRGSQFNETSFEQGVLETTPETAPQIRGIGG